jgi:crotonobetaine/carnitine-CoA ligase
MSVALQFADDEHHALPFILRHRASRCGDQPFLTWCDDQPLSFGEIDGLSDQIAAGLSALGARRGDRIALMLPNCREFVPLWFAATKLGTVEVPVNPDLKGRLLAHVLRNSGASIVVVHVTALENLATGRAAMPPGARAVVVDGGRDEAAEHGFVGAVSYQELLTHEARPSQTPVHFSDPMAILYTSGTTGAAKGVIVSYEHAYIFAERTAHSLGMTSSDGYFSPLPLYHIDAQVFGTFLPLIFGARTALRERFSASRYWDQIRASGSTVTNMLGAMAHVLWKQEPTERDADHPLRVAQAIPMIKFQEEFERRFEISLVTGYGQTETSLVSYDRPRAGRKGSCGRVMPGFQVAIVDEHDRPLPSGRTGEVVIRSDHPYWITTGYHAMPEATIETMRNLWFHTGDAGHLDADGWLYFDGRIKDAIRRRGENVSAEELESVVNEHPEIVESAALAVPSELTEDDIRLFVVRRAGAELAEERVLQHCLERLPWFMVPRYIDIWDTALPRTPSEKIAKAELRASPVHTAWDRDAHGHAIRRPPPVPAVRATPRH